MITNNIVEYKSLAEAALLNNLSKQNIRHKCKTGKEYKNTIWKTKKQQLLT